jgi:RNA methyltransferase, TrmH family
VGSALGAGAVVELFTTIDGYGRHAGIVATAQRRGVDVWQLAEATLASLCDTVTPQGVVAICRQLHRPDLATVLRGKPSLVVIFAGIADPGNAGTVLRTADAAGAGAVVFCDGAVDPYNGKCVRASAGSLFHLDVVRGGSPAGHVAAVREVGMVVLAADVRGELGLDEAAGTGLLARRTAWLFGSEAHGLAPDLAAAADHRVAVPMYGRAESLNLAAAAAVCLYASARAQRPPRASGPPAPAPAPTAPTDRPHRPSQQPR